MSVGENNKKVFLRKLIMQFAGFGMVGIMNTLLSLFVTYIVMFLLKYIFDIYTMWSLNVCTTFGYVAGVCNSYYWNNKYVFTNKKENNGKRIFVKVFICYGITYLISILFMDILVNYLFVPSLVAPILRLVVTIPLNFIANKLWAFKDYGDEDHKFINK